MFCCVNALTAIFKINMHICERHTPRYNGCVLLSFRRALNKLYYFLASLTFFEIVDGAANNKTHSPASYSKSLIRTFGSACAILNCESRATQKFICNLITEFSGGNGPFQVQKNDKPDAHFPRISLISNEILINLPSYFHYYCMMSVSVVQQREPNWQR